MAAAKADKRVAQSAASWVDRTAAHWAAVWERTKVASTDVHSVALSAFRLVAQMVA
jgi:hypothetical protein